MAYLRFNTALKRIREVVEQSAGALRAVPVGRFLGDLPQGLDDESAMARAISTPRVESSITSVTPSSSSPPVLGDLRIYEVQVSVKVLRVVTPLEQVSDADRDELQALAAQDADVLSQALGFPGNLARTADGVETEIVSGLLVYRSSSVLVGKRTDDGAQTITTTHVFRGHMLSRPSQATDFMILVRTSITSSSAVYTAATNTNQFRFYGVGTYDIDWGDGTTSVNVTDTQTHTYPSPGDYVVRVRNWTGPVRRHSPPATNTTDGIKIIELLQWGNTQWTSCQGMFLKCAQMIGRYYDTPNLSSPSLSMQSMFQEARSFNGSPFVSIGTWDTSTVTSMTLAFATTASLNVGLSGIDNWNVESVTSFNNMFDSCPFNQPIGSWKIKNASMIRMFRFASSFNQPLPWDVSGVSSMLAMFEGASSFNQNIGSWNVSNVGDMRLMFNGANAFNQDLGTWVLNDNVLMANMLDTTSIATGLSAENYSRTLIGWANERSATGNPNSRSLGALNRRYNATVYGGSPYDNAVSARANLVLATGSGGGGWTISGDAQI